MMLSDTPYLLGNNSTVGLCFVFGKELSFFVTILNLPAFLAFLKRDYLDSRFGAPGRPEKGPRQRLTERVLCYTISGNQEFQVQLAEGTSKTLAVPLGLRGKTMI